MIGVFDSGIGGLTVFRALVKRFAGTPFVYLGDHANVPYGDRAAGEVVDLTCKGVERLFERGCKLVLLGCNTATAVAARQLQQQWLPRSRWAGLARGHGRARNILGIVAPTVEAATQTAWAVSAPQYPQKYNTDVIAVFATTRTAASNVYPEEISKRCPKVTVVQQVCAGLAGAIEAGAPDAELNAQVALGVSAMLAQTGGEPPHRAILGCTHFPLVAHLFAQSLPPFTRILSQPDIVADSLEDYLARHTEYVGDDAAAGAPVLLTTGAPRHVNETAKLFWPGAPSFHKLPG